MLREMGSKAQKPADPAPPPPVPKTADAYESGQTAVAAEVKKSSYLNSFLTGKRRGLGSGAGGGNSYLGGQ